MIYKILQYIRGYLRIRISGYSAERFLNACSHRGIRLWDMKSSNESYEMSISIRGFRRIKPIVRKTGARVTIIRRIGLPFFLYRYRKRKSFFAGAVFCLFLIYTLSRFIWSIDIRGNLTRTDETLLEFLQTQNVHGGMRISDIDCSRIVKDIRKEYNDIIWVSASIEGTKLIIQVKENEDAEIVKTGGEETPSEGPLDIVADKDCVITGIITRKGVPQIQEGAQVKSGDILVSGQVPVMNDAGEITGYHYQESDADIFGQMSLDYQDTHSLTYEKKEAAGLKKTEEYLRIGDFRIGFGGIKNNYDNFVLYSEEIPFKLFDNFYLPISVGERKAVPYLSSEEAYGKDELQGILSGRFREYCEDLEKKGVEIIQNDVKIYTGSKEAVAKGTLTVIMPVGTLKASQITELPEAAEENAQSGE